MDHLRTQLENYYREYYKLQHLDIVDNQELNQLVKSNFDELIIPNIGAIVEILEEFIRTHLVKSNKNLVIFDWLEYVFNSNIYELTINLMKQHIDNLDEDEKLLPYFIIKIEFIKLNIFKELFDSNQNNEYLTIRLNDKITYCKNNISHYYEDLINSHSNFTKTIQLVNELFAKVEK
jgi:hypothetical protein